VILLILAKWVVPLALAVAVIRAIGWIAGWR
jgi:hypothetical protein